MIAFPKAKINLGLRITGKRPDGYHNIETIFYPVGLSDALEFVPAPGRSEDEIVITGLEINAKDKNNLVIKALNIFRKRYPVPFLRIHLHKTIPAGAGLGGGSSDAACMLRALSRYLNLNPGGEELKTMALEAGSDCPFFIDPVPSSATGRGEILKAIEPVLEGYRLILVNPGISISTKEAYFNTRISSPDKSLVELIRLPLKKWKKLIINDFEDYAFKMYPEIEELRKALYRSGALYSSMSGSGSTVYGIFQYEAELPERLKKYVIYTGQL